ncbi:HIRAN domain-containing protein [Methyloversatilis sp. XJ19-13]|uniref:HIRAN domain-containing protein n=1 Tax=Methyloversatilis sp. XJ19-13 TaxID=2963430 RepID=UPI00211B7E58|nr:HIRAN domain-containing protein [Methyloversatilis sp. XJ19-13]MCQ9373053.1 HIRAN domain-containing protein [Methyloversatilis sp. XJ19-13]
MRSACSALALLAWLAADLASAQSLRLLAQRSPLAGAQFHQLHAVRQGLREGDALTLEREPGNRHDRRAIRVLWRGHMLGYLPRAANFEAAAEMDAGQRLSARIGRLTDDPDPWRRVRIDVYVELAPAR